ncbi:hypothetical protein [Thiolapillus sp.]|uniref:hypothetical protein n=1 Tax=Thiolapillus sp. TaxID=2017437 RepID=UPI003AF40C11
MTRTAGAPIDCQRPSRFWGLGCPKIFHEAEDTLVFSVSIAASMLPGRIKTLSNTNERLHQCYIDCSEYGI